ncbi:hypothetical protein TDMWS_06690 [Thermodesulfomicrobium sp. WS]|uniref:hypothetical protein n=1 Tax=Thermodesulfomicrobium sp. WS TaxID=3004129 RepID=UPI00249082C7|nr:hypothetical protein [Thermodesulfomicrobium sp. WS]BDV00584.1 hypothetical protein TDMWS_06690 [Thermodesulfomicrobium sp. WS]
MQLPRISGSSPAEKILRFVGVLGVFVLVGYLFWVNHQRSLESVTDQGIVWDQTKSLSPEQRDTLIRFARVMQNTHGITVRIRITREGILLPTMDSKTLMIALCPPRREARVVFPPLLRHALRPGLEAELEGPVLLPYWENGRWQEGLGQIVLTITEHMERLGRP